MGPKQKDAPKQKDGPKQKDMAVRKAKADGGPELIGITASKLEDLPDWYAQVLTKGQMLDYYDISGCYIYLPSSVFIWEEIRSWFRSEIMKLGVQDCLFPVFISAENLQREKDHLEGFAAEVAWVTKGGKSDLEKPIAIRPTSETAMYPYFAKRIRSHRDLPLKLNQWNNVVRWEFKHPIPFLRTREFWWQEGHTAHLTQKEAATEVRQILELYAKIYTDLLAVPVIKGTKTKNETFAGALYSETLEGFIAATGRGIQAGTSHCLGQHFSKMFGITVEDPNVSESGEKKPPINVWQNSWGLSMRTIGVMVMIHSDDKGLVLPPRVAFIQVVIIPVGITAKLPEETKQSLYAQVEALAKILEVEGIRAHTDMREGYSPGWKFNDWELKGIPVRMEFGPKDNEKHVVTVARRDQAGSKTTIPITSLGPDVKALLETIQADMYRKAEDEYMSHRIKVTKWEDFVPALDAKNVCIIPFCLGGECEDKIKEQSSRRQEGAEQEDARAPSMGAKSLCIPFDQEEMPEGTKCLNPLCEAQAQKWVQFGRSY